MGLTLVKVNFSERPKLFAALVAHALRLANAQKHAMDRL